MKYAYFDIETLGLYGKFFLGGVLYDKEEVFITNSSAEMINKLESLIENGYILVGHNLMYDFSVLDWKPKSYKQFEDTYLIAKVLQGKLKLDKFGLEDLVSIYKLYRYTINKEVIQRLLSKGQALNIDVKEYLKQDLEATKNLFLFFAKKFSWAFKNRAYVVDKAFLLHLIDIQKRGLPFNFQEAQKSLYEMLVLVNSTVEGFYRKYQVNINSPLQIRKKFKFLSTKRTDLLHRLLELKESSNSSEEKQIIETILSYKEIKKLTEFLQKFVKQAKENEGRIYGKFNPAGATSGRLTCQDENLMQIPRKLRKFFQTDKYFLIYDFSQIELRLAGQMWKEPFFIRAFQKGEDLHLQTAKVLFKKEDITKEERYIGKTFNFAMLYGASEKTLQSLLFEAGIFYPLEKVQEFKRDWLKFYKQIQYIHKETWKYMKEKGGMLVYTKLGRYVYTNNFNEALNIPIQGTGAELLKGVIIKFLRKFPNAQIVNLVHDEIQIECETEEEAKEYQKTLDECLKEAWAALFSKVEVPVLGESVISKSLEKN